MTKAMSSFYSFFNPHLNCGRDWVCREDDMSEVETIQGYTTDVRQLTVDELSTDWVEELCDCYFSDGSPEASYREEFVKWIGAGGEAVASKVEWPED